MENSTYVLTDDAGYTTQTYTVRVPECCKNFFDWLYSEGLINDITMEKINLDKIAFEIKEKK